MLAWLLTQLGLTSSMVHHLDQAQFEFKHPWMLFVGLPLLLPVGWFIFWRQRRHLASSPLALRIALTSLRVLILVLLIVVLAEPSLKVDAHAEKKPIVAVLFDRSQSMTLPAGPFVSDSDAVQLAKAAGYRLEGGRLDPEIRKALDRLSRAKLAQMVAQAAAGHLWEPLSRKYDVRFFTFSRKPEELAVNAAKLELPEPSTPGGLATHLGDAVAAVLDQAAGRPVAGIVLFTDGQNTGGHSPAEAAKAALGLGTPLFTVPVGVTTPLQDVAIVDVFSSGVVSVGDTASVTVTVESQGFDKRPIKVELREDDKVLDTKDLTLNGSEQQQVELTFQATTPGIRSLTVNIPPLPEEIEPLRANNTDTAFVRVTGEKLKVLYVEGLPRWDFRFLKNSIQRDHGLGGSVKEPDVRLEAEVRRWPPEQQATALPRTLEQLSNYHTIILGDVSPKLLTPAFIELLDQAVREKGVGLIVEAGPNSMPHAFDDKLKKLLPVLLRPGAAGLESRPAKPFRVELTPEGSLQESLRFHDDPGRNRNTWEHVPTFYWCAAAERAAPGAAVLATNPGVEMRQGKLPLIAYHYAGQGKVLFVGTDSTWTWRQNFGDRFFYKFWGQSIRFVARRDKAGSKESFLEARPYRVQPGEPVQVELMAFTAAGPRTEPSLRVRVPGLKPKDTLDLQADPSLEGRYTGKFTPTTPGDVHIEFDLDGGQKPLEARVKVLGAAEELRYPNVNRAALEQLAVLSGGRVVELTELAKLPEWLKGEAQLSGLHLEETVWDNWLFLVLIVLLYSVDVGLRRLTGLS